MLSENYLSYASMAHNLGICLTIVILTVVMWSKEHWPGRLNNTRLCHYLPSVYAHHSLCL